MCPPAGQMWWPLGRTWWLPERMWWPWGGSRQPPSVPVLLGLGVPELAPGEFGLVPQCLLDPGGTHTGSVGARGVSEGDLGGPRAGDSPREGPRGDVGGWGDKARGQGQSPGAGDGLGDPPHPLGGTQGRGRNGDTRTGMSGNMEGGTRTFGDPSPHQLIVLGQALGATRGARLDLGGQRGCRGGGG